MKECSCLVCSDVRVLLHITLHVSFTCIDTCVWEGGCLCMCLETFVCVSVWVMYLCVGVGRGIMWVFECGGKAVGWVHILCASA